MYTQYEKMLDQIFELPFFNSVTRVTRPAKKISGFLGILVTRQCIFYVKVLTICNPENRKLAQNASVVDQHRSDADADPTLHLDHFDAKPDPDANPNRILQFSGKNILYLYFC